MTNIFETGTTKLYQAQIQEWVAQGATFFVGHSAGKDSQAMYAVISSLVPHDQIVVVHADLPGVEWAGVQDHINANIDHDLNVVQGMYKDGSAKGLLDKIENNAIRLRDKGSDANFWPARGAQYCTGELKVDPIWKFIRNHDAKIAINCVGIRAQESGERAKKSPLTENKKNSNSVREAYDFYPIFDISEERVWEIIEQSGQKRHFAYDQGNTRLSCLFCVFGNANDWNNAIEAGNMDLYKKMVDLEKKYGKTIKQGQTIEEWVGVKVETDPLAIPSFLKRSA
jgi:3'-phosphoadenosine 5'-phosphosulfate sulfotransferase (PAPS reductase)/FAD synthetase